MRHWLLLFGLLLLSFAASTQIWVKPNATWHYDYWVPGYYGFVKIEHVGDEQIDTKNTMVLKTTDYQFGMDQFGQTHLLGVHVWDTNYVYTEGDTVYYYKNSQFYKLLDFSKQTGESYLIANSAGNNECNTDSWATVLNTGITDQGYDYIELSSTEDSEFRLNGNFNNRYGGGSFLFPTVAFCDPSVILESYMFTFKCFEDDELYVNPTGQDCEYLLNHLGFESLNQVQVAVYPNPVLDVVTIKGEGEFQYFEVLSSNGQVLLVDKMPSSKQIDTSALLNGVYLLKIQTSDDKTVVLRFVK